MKNKYTFLLFIFGITLAFTQEKDSLEQKKDIKKVTFKNVISQQNSISNPEEKTFYEEIEIIQKGETIQQQVSPQEANTVKIEELGGGRIRYTLVDGSIVYSEEPAVPIEQQYLKLQETTKIKEEK